MNKEDILYHKLTNTPIICDDWDHAISCELVDVVEILVHTKNPKIRYAFTILALHDIDLIEGHHHCRAKYVTNRQYRLFIRQISDISLLKLLAKCPDDKILYLSHIMSK